MKKAVRRFVCTGTIICILLSLLSGTAFAAGLPSYDMTKDEWLTYNGSVTGDNTLVSLTPGSDASQLNLCWHAPFSDTAPVVRVSLNADMSDYTEFSGTADFSDNVKTQLTYRVTLTGLSENTEYYYTYGNDGLFSAPAVYRTLSDESYKFLLVSDAQPNNKEGRDLTEETYIWYSTLNSAFKAHDDISFIATAGDNTHNGQSAYEWSAFLSPPMLRNVPLAAAVGNHDNKGTTYSRYLNNPNEYHGILPLSAAGLNYWFRYGDALYLYYNSANASFYDHYSFTVDAVEKNADAKWRIAVFHHDIYGTGPHASDDDNALLTGVFAPIMDEFDVDICFTGHDHIYGRSYYMYDNKIVNTEGYDGGAVTNPEGTLYLTASSSAGKNRILEEPMSFEWLAMSVINENPFYSTVEVSSDNIKITTYDSVDGSLQDEFTINKTENEHPDVTVDASSYILKMVSIILGDYSYIIEAIKAAFDSVIGALI